MPEFQVQVTLRLEAGCSFTVKAKDEQAAQEKAEKIVKRMSIKSWEGYPTDLDNIEWVESDQDAELDYVEEA